MSKTTKKIIALIGARGGSKGVKDKNIKLLHGHPLIAYSIAVCKLSKCIDRVIISTDSKKIAVVAEKYQGSVPFMRPEKYATDDSTDIDYIRHALKWLKNNEKYTPDLVVHIRPTTPIREVKIIDNAIMYFRQCREASSLRSVHKLEESPCKMFLKEEEYLKPFMLGGTGEFYNLPRQHFPQVYYPNGYVDILRPHIIKDNGLHGDKILAFETPKILEIDSEENFVTLSNQPIRPPIYYYLENNFEHLRGTSQHRLWS